MARSVSTWTTYSSTLGRSQNFERSLVEFSSDDERLRQHKLYLKAEKCEFEREQIEYLGLVISHNKVAMDPAKVSAVMEWPNPSSKKEVQSFLGFANFY